MRRKLLSLFTALSMMFTGVAVSVTPTDAQAQSYRSDRGYYGPRRGQIRRNQIRRNQIRRSQARRYRNARRARAYRGYPRTRAYRYDRRQRGYRGARRGYYR